VRALLKLKMKKKKGNTGRPVTVGKKSTNSFLLQITKSSQFAFGEYSQCFGTQTPQAFEAWAVSLICLSVDY